MSTVVAVVAMVPQSTLDYLRTREGAQVVARLQSMGRVPRH